MVLLQFCCENSGDQRIGEAKAGSSAVLLKFEEKNQNPCPYRVKTRDSSY